MEGSWSVVLTHVAILCALGLAMEVVFTGLVDYASSRDPRLKGYTYVWMIPIYALVYPFCLLLYPRVSYFPLLIRGVIYMFVIYGVEYASGWALRRFVGQCPWEPEYRKGKWHVDGLIRLDFAPAWIGAALIFEWTYRVLRGLA
jgi:hypothetical protein